MKRAAVLAASLWLARPCAGAGLACPADALDKDGRGVLLLFSALPLGGTKFARAWEKARPRLIKDFPGLRFEKTENLHATLVFVGAGWDPARAAELEAHGLDGPDISSGPLTMQGAPQLFGPRKDVAALRLDPVPSEWERRLMKDRQALTDAGLRKRDMFDDVFIPHVSLAYAAEPDAQRPELERFERTLTKHAGRFADLRFLLDRSIQPEFFVVQGKDETTRFARLRSVCAAPPAP